MMTFARPRPATSVRVSFALAALTIGHAAAGCGLFGCPSRPSLFPEVAPSASAVEPPRAAPLASADPPTEAVRPAAVP